MSQSARCIKVRWLSSIKLWSWLFSTRRGSFQDFCFWAVRKKKSHAGNFRRFFFLYFLFQSSEAVTFYQQMRGKKEKEKRSFRCILAAASLPVPLSFTAFFSCFFFRPECWQSVSQHPHCWHPTCCQFLTYAVEWVIGFGRKRGHKTSLCRSNLCLQLLKYSVFCKFYFAMFSSNHSLRWLKSIQYLSVCSNFQRLCGKTQHSVLSQRGLVLLLETWKTQKIVSFTTVFFMHSCKQRAKYSQCGIYRVVLGVCELCKALLGIILFFFFNVTYTKQ